MATPFVPKQWHQRFHASPRAEVYGVVNARIADTIDKFFSIGCVMTTNTKDVPFFVSHKRYHIHWPTPKTGYQPTLKIIFVVVEIYFYD
jgi:hypothetical protein